MHVKKSYMQTFSFMKNYFKLIIHKVPLNIFEVPFSLYKADLTQTEKSTQETSKKNLKREISRRLRNVLYLPMPHSGIPRFFHSKMYFFPAI